MVPDTIFPFALIMPCDKVKKDTAMEKYVDEKSYSEIVFFVGTHVNLNARQATLEWMS